MEVKMGYPKSINEDRAARLAKVFQQIRELREGQTLLIENTPDAIRQNRMDIYTWLFHRGEKSLFKIRQLSPTSLQIIRQSSSTPTVTMVETNQRIKDFVVDCLLDCTPDEAKARTCLAIDEGRFNDLEGIEILREYERITS